MKKINEHIKPSKQIIVGRQDSLAGKGTYNLKLFPGAHLVERGSNSSQLSSGLQKCAMPHTIRTPSVCTPILQCSRVIHNDRVISANFESVKPKHCRPFLCYQLIFPIVDL